MNEQNTGSALVFDALSKLQQLLREVHESSKKITGETQSVNNDLNSIRDQEKMLAENVAEIADGSVPIQNSILEVKDLTTLNTQKIQLLSDSVGKFIIRES